MLVSANKSNNNWNNDNSNNSSNKPYVNNLNNNEMHLYPNQYEWYQGMKLLWKQVILHENILSVSDLTVWTNQCFLQKKIDNYLLDARCILKPKISQLRESILDTDCNSHNDHAIRCKQFNEKITQLCDNLKNKMIDQKFNTPGNELSHISKDLIELYRINFTLRFDMLKNDNIKEFNQTSEQQTIVDIGNYIIRLTNEARLALEYANITDFKKIEQKYFHTFDGAIEKLRTDNRPFESIQKQLMQRYVNVVLQNNRNHGRHPTRRDQLTPLTDMTCDTSEFFFSRQGNYQLQTKANMVHHGRKLRFSIF